MKNLFVPYELAVKLQELGFNEPCLATFKDGDIQRLDGWGETNDLYEDSEGESIYCTAILYQQVIDWFEDRGLNVFTTYNYATGCWSAVIQRFGELEPLYKELFYRDKYEALNKAIGEAIKLINNHKN